MPTVEITCPDPKSVAVRSPYHPDFVAKAHDLNGKFINGLWAFDARDRARVEAACRDVYGTAGEATATATVRLDLDSWESTRAAFACGREVASRASRDYGVRLGEGVVVLEGGFPASGGSVKNPALSPRPGTVLEVRDVPLGLAEREAARYDTGCVTVTAVHPLDPPDAPAYPQVGPEPFDFAAFVRGLDDARVAALAEAVTAEKARRRKETARA